MVKVLKRKKVDSDDDDVETNPVIETNNDIDGDDVESIDDDDDDSEEDSEEEDDTDDKQPTKKQKCEWADDGEDEAMEASARSDEEEEKETLKFKKELDAFGTTPTAKPSSYPNQLSKITDKYEKHVDGDDDDDSTDADSVADIPPLPESNDFIYIYDVDCVPSRDDSKIIRYSGRFIECKAIPFDELEQMALNHVRSLDKFKDQNIKSVLIRGLDKFEQYVIENEENSVVEDVANDIIYIFEVDCVVAGQQTTALKYGSRVVSESRIKFKELEENILDYVKTLDKFKTYNIIEVNIRGLKVIDQYIAGKK